MTGAAFDEIAFLLNCSFVDARCRRRRPPRGRGTTRGLNSPRTPFQTKTEKTTVSRSCSGFWFKKYSRGVEAVVLPLAARVRLGLKRRTSMTLCALLFPAQQCSFILHRLQHCLSCFLRRCHIIARSLGHLLPTAKKNGSSSASIISAANYLRPAP